MMLKLQNRFFFFVRKIREEEHNIYIVRDEKYKMADTMNFLWNSLAHLNPICVTPQHFFSN